MRVNQVMIRALPLASPDQPIREAARIMARMDADALPVGENDQLVGMITEHDIAIHAVAAGKGPETRVRDVMSKAFTYCFEDDDIDDVASQVLEVRGRLLPVVDRDRCLVGVVSLAELISDLEPDEGDHDVLEELRRAVAPPGPRRDS